MGVKEAKELFKDMGILVEEDGTISKDLSIEQMDKLKEWYDNTRDGTIQMPTEQSFYENVLLATSLFPQEENGNINYMFGKGIGIEIALRGKVEGREKNDVDIPYRSHSDFEMYGMDGDYDSQFIEIFGAQERYPTTKTKGLVELPPDLMPSTVEEVELDGVKVLVPQLELLFLDKYLRQESTPREDGLDAVLLAKQYDLDYGLVYKYLLEYSIKPEITKKLSLEVPGRAQISRNINRFFDGYTEEYLEDYDSYPSREDLCNEINGRINGYKAANPATLMNGIPVSAYQEFSEEDLIDMGNSRYGISNGFAKNIVNNLAKGYGESFCQIIQTFRQLNDFCIENGIHSISEEKLQQLESILEQYMVNEMGRDSKELSVKSIAQIATEYFEQGDEQQKDMIEH